MNNKANNSAKIKSSNFHKIIDITRFPLSQSHKMESSINSPFPEKPVRKLQGYKRLFETLDALGLILSGKDFRKVPR